jgi:peptidoglycan hydrolase-like protein with peptidoglycan-binding domain
MNRPWADKIAGDIVQYDFNHNGTSDHTGILEKINSNGTIDVIEGNTSTGNDCNGGKVMLRRRGKSQVNYVIRPKYNDDVTAKMVIDTARAELGVVEKPSGSNKVKYNKWFYGRDVSGPKYPWCAVFVCWDFAHVKKTSTAPAPKKTTPEISATYTGPIPFPTLKKGSKGSRVKQFQKFLNWCNEKYKIGFKRLTEDGKFGKKTKKACKLWQSLFGLTGDGVYGKKSYAKAKKFQKPTKKVKTTNGTVKTNAKAATPSPAAKAAVKWALAIAKSGKYGYKKWSKKKSTHRGPICHPNSGKGWNCIGFVTAAYHHGARLPIECSNKGFGTDKFFTNVTLESWRKRNGKNWNIITNGGGKGGADIPASKLILGDVLICYDKKGKFHHFAMYVGDGKYIDCTNTSKNHIAVRPYTKLTGKYHVTRAFRYVG